MLELSAPKKLTFWAGVVLYVLGLLLPFLNQDPLPLMGLSTGFLLLVFGGLILIIGCAFRNF